MDRYWPEKYTLPNVREGSIVEYEYTVQTPFSASHTPRTWYFQQKIPVKWSEYRITIPDYFYYKVLQSGYMSMVINERTSTSVDLFPGQQGASASAYRFAIKDIPAFHNEAYMTTEDDYLAKVEFELARYQGPDLLVKDLSVTWETLDQTLLNDADFGGQLKRGGFLRETAKTLLAQHSDTLNRVTAAYDFIRRSIKWNEEAATIPTTLKENAHGVIRYHETIFTVKSAGEAQQRTRSIITVLDEQGDDYAKMVVPYDKLSKVNAFEGALYDADGKLIKKLKKADIQDYNLFDDQRYKVAEFPKQPTYPYTVEFSIETTERNLMVYPSWAPQNEEFLSVERATFTVNMPTSLTLRYKEMNVTEPVVMTPSANGGKMYTWTLSNIPAVEFEPLSPPAREQLPVVYTAPTDFEVQDYKGKLTTWSDLGMFYHGLNDNRDQIPDALRQQAIELTKNETTTVGKVRKLYTFLHNHTRYVSIQLGIGGWQTIEAEKVASSKYGDCKALTNYMKALLKAVNVDAYPALVRAGGTASDALTDFPSFQFNHVILCVPNERDTLFLECTNGHNPMGYVSDFTGNRHALLVLPTGSRLIKTPVYQSTDNRQLRWIAVSLTEQGDATADVRARYTGLQQDTYSGAIHGLSRDEQRSWRIKRISIPAFELNSFLLTEEPAALPAVTETMKLAIRRWATASGTRLFLPLNLMSALSSAPPMLHPRKAPLKLNTSYDFDDSDTITYQLPKGYTPEYRIEPVTVDSKFGRYTAYVGVEGDRVTYIRRVTMHSGKFPAVAYTDWVDFRKKIAKADRVQMVFVKTN